MMMFKMTREDKVAAFVRAAGKKPFNRNDPKLDVSIINCLDEEHKEFQDALWIYATNPNEANRKELVKEWADLQYVLSQAAWYFDIPADPAFNRVHQNNMTKLGPDGKAIFNESGKIMKPEGYVKADMSGL